MKKIIFILINIVFVFTGCQYEYEPYFSAPEPAIQLEDLNAYSFFKTGTYWIYKDSASGVEDSVYVFYDTVYSYFHSGNSIVSAGNYNYYECHAHSYTDTYNYYYKIDMGYYGSTKSIGTWRIKTKPGDYVGQTFLMSNKFIDGEAIAAYTSPGVISYKKSYDSVLIDNLIFNDVVWFNDTKNASENLSTPFGSINPATDFYIAKNIGIVKKHVYDTIFNTINKTDNLIRYHIVQ
jgi:hypothetical protein